MKFTYSDHAQERINERGISKSEIEHALRQGSPKNAAGGCLSKTVEVNGRTIRVIYKRDSRKPGSYHVITVYPVD